MASVGRREHRRNDSVAVSVEAHWDGIRPSRRIRPEEIQTNSQRGNFDAEKFLQLQHMMMSS